MHRKLRYAEMAKALGISERLLKNWVRDRVVPYTKVKRLVLFDPIKVESALERFQREPR
jgi:excisionase family DNA binding protein